MKLVTVPFLLIGTFSTLCDIEATQFVDLPKGKTIESIIPLTIRSEFEESSLEIQVGFGDSIRSIHEKIESSDMEFDSKFHHLTFKEKSLKRSKTVLFYGMNAGSQLFIRKLTKDISTNFEFSKFDTSQEINFSEKAPKWRTISKGFNLEGVCVNSSCGAYKRKVWVPKGFGVFSLGEEICESVCPECNQEVEKITECGFFYCKYRIKGRKTNKEKVDISDSHKSRSGFRKFISGGEDSTKYAYLKIIVDKHDT